MSVANLPPRLDAAGSPPRPGSPLSPEPCRDRRSRVVSLAADPQRGVFHFRALTAVMHGVGQVLKAGVAEQNGGGFVRRDRRSVRDFLAKLGLALLDRDFAQAGEARGSEFAPAAEAFVLGSVRQEPEANAPPPHFLQ